VGYRQGLLDLRAMHAPLSATWPLRQNAALLIEQPLMNGLWRIEESVAMASLVRIDRCHVDDSWGHFSEKRIEIVEIFL
jgi:hypothetical protein